jgi:hypothetical protein
MIYLIIFFILLVSFLGYIFYMIDNAEKKWVKDIKRLDSNYE